MTCERCGRETAGSVCSTFNTEQICIDPCSLAEQAHPEYERARAVEAAAVARGDHNSSASGYRPTFDRRRSR